MAFLFVTQFRSIGPKVHIMALIQNRYRIDYRAEIVRPLMAAIRRGESVCLVGLAGVGKSNLVSFLEEPEVTKHYLPDLSDRTHIVWVSCRSADQPKEEIFEALLTRVWLVARRQGYDLADIAPAGTAKYRMLQNVLGEFCGAHGQRLVFVLDEFEGLIQQQPEDFFDDLRALRDDHRPSGQLTFVTITHRMPQVVPGRTIFGQTKFFALLRDHIYPIPPYRFADADEMLNVLLQKTEGLEIVPEDRQRLIAVSGGHSGLLRDVFSVVTPNFGMSIPKLLRLGSSSERVREMCNQIWTHLHRDERQALRSLARNQAISPETTGFLQRRGLLRDGASPTFFSPLFGEYVSSIQSKPVPS